jgi:ribosomal protein S18 acetylase RimI-like enzyme
MLVHGRYSAATGNDIRPLRLSSDLSGLADLLEQAFGPELAFGGEQMLRELRFLGRLGPLSLLLLDLSSPVDGLANGFVCERDGRVVGNITLSRPMGQARRWQLSNVAVLDDYRGRGIGRSLVETAIEVILQRGGHSVYLYVREDNPAAVHLYDSIGFVAVDRLTRLLLEGRRSDAGRLADPAGETELSLLRRLRPAEGQALYELAAQARGAGQKWLGLPRRRRFVRTADERLFQWLSGLWTGQRETFWGVPSTGQRLCAGLSLQASSGRGRKPHQMEVWIHPGYRGRLETELAQDVVTLVARLSARMVVVNLPACERAMEEALLGQAFSRVRTLILMKLEL